MSEPPLRVMLVDDHKVVRDGIKLLLNDTTDVVDDEALVAAYLARHTTLAGSS
jgi:DNA-binding NarL/FixJ family response regulator